MLVVGSQHAIEKQAHITGVMSPFTVTGAAIHITVSILIGLKACSHLICFGMHIRWKRIGSA